MVRGKPELELWGFYGVQANLNLFQLDTVQAGQLFYWSHFKHF